MALVLHQSVYVVLRPMFTGRHFKYVRDTQQRLLRVLVGDNLTQNNNTTAIKYQRQQKLSHSFYNKSATSCTLPRMVYSFKTTPTQQQPFDGHYTGQPMLFHLRTCTTCVYNGRLAWYNVVLTPQICSSVKYSQLSSDHIDYTISRYRSLNSSSVRYRDGHIS